jgi:hypothetical protein
VYILNKHNKYKNLIDTQCYNFISWDEKNGWILVVRGGRGERERKYTDTDVEFLYANY